MLTKAEKIEKLNFPNVDIDAILRKDPNRFLLAAASAKRARQLKDGAKPLVDYVPNEPMNHVAVALKEIYEDKIQISINEKNNEEESFLEELDIALDEEIKETEAQAVPEKEDKKKEKKAKKSLAS